MTVKRGHPTPTSETVAAITAATPTSTVSRTIATNNSVRCDWIC